ncbi:class I SAM-dependent methyltransferase [Amycolatopsis sp. NPDC004169]|uniref:class I SAM-dependent methyltransferase n=1 Tax=Amycolatopsis sp. NPDC004169 TaxID=3154453 RepID=UPI0033AC3C95
MMPLNREEVQLVNEAETNSPRQSTREIFTRIYASEEWTLVEEPVAGYDDHQTSRSGLGSNLAQTEALRAGLPPLIAELGVRSVLDLPCGDFFWMSRVELGVQRYIGADIVPEVVERNRRLFARADRDFEVLDLARDQLPLVDLIFSRDCLVHLSDAEALAALENVRRSGATYFAATTFTDRTEMNDIRTGGWRPLNLCRAPFNLPDPLRILNEQCTEVYTAIIDGAEVELHFSDKSIGVWTVADL